MGREAFKGVSDEELIQRAKAGEPGAKEELLERYMPRFIDWARNQTPSTRGDRPGASDLGQVSAAHAYDRFHTFEGSTGKQFFAWLKRIYGSKASDSRRHAEQKKRQAPAGLVSIEEHGEPANPSMVKSASQIVALKDEWQALSPHLHSLPEVRQRIIKLRMDGYSDAEIAQQLNRNENFVANGFKRGMDQLKHLVQEQPAGRGGGQRAHRLRAGTRMGEHVIGRHVDSGAMSDVYQARHRTSGQQVAVKVLFSEWRDQPEVRARFVNEAQTLHEVRHPRLVTLFAHGVLRSGLPYMVLEWLPSNLKKEMERLQGPLAPEHAVHVAAQLADALAAMHQQGFVHRDLKPENILMCPPPSSPWEVKLADLGLAKQLPAEQAPPSTTGPRQFVSTIRGTPLGTSAYMAPEQWLDAKAIDPKADVYSLGILLFQLLAGRLPFVAQQEQDWRALHARTPVPLELLPESVPASLRQLLAGMLKKRSSARLTMKQVLARLEQARSRAWRASVRPGREALQAGLPPCESSPMTDPLNRITVDVRIQMQDGDLFATWSFYNEQLDGDATTVKLSSGQQYEVTYRLLDTAAWQLDAASLRRVTSDANRGFVTLTTGQTTPEQTLQDGAGTVSVTSFSQGALTLLIDNTLPYGSEDWTLGLSLTVSARNTQGRPKQSSQDPQMVLEPVTVPPSGN